MEGDHNTTVAGIAGGHGAMIYRHLVARITVGDYLT